MRSTSEDQLRGALASIDQFTGRGLQAAAYWQTTPNWKHRRFRNVMIRNHFHRVTCWDRVTRIRDFGPQWATAASRDWGLANNSNRRKSRDTRTQQARPASGD